jgi:predicted ABC-type ATPase
VLAGVNGAGKSSIGGHLLEQAGLSWFNPDIFAREMVKTLGYGQAEANAAAWHEGMRRFDSALENGQSYAFETTLGGRSVPARIRAAAASHDVLIWFCGLSTPEQHISRVHARVARGAHDIPEDLIRRRYQHARENLIVLMPYLSRLQIYDNSHDAKDGEAIPDPVLLAQMERGRLVWPTDAEVLQQTPEWAKPLLEAAILLSS